ncbi:YqeG family HAD IIIA-type phosphatase [Candidatus Woesearchaeota archaeon]|nr:YqeG family HAD IIIA-type phosphatase [Candidatus Woesearchaeota archaeon]
MQNFNLEGTLYFPWVMLRKSLAIPHFSVADISKIYFAKLKHYGFKGLVFDKDNTLTAPYKLEIYPTIIEAFAQCRDVFGNRIAIMSNSAGTNDDRNYHEQARAIEDALGIPVLRHTRKKPWGIRAVRKYFGCDPSELAMFGDRIFTDVVFGNRYGMLTIHTALLTEEGDNPTAAKVRSYELPLVEKWIKRGKRPPHHEKYHADICLERLIKVS